MYDVGTPVLYKDMVIPVDKLNSDFQQVVATTKEYRGLSHVRTLRVTSKDSEDYMSAPCYEIISQLLSAIPTNSLAHFQ